MTNPVENTRKAALITRPAALQELADELSRASIIAVDTESNSLHAYREQVCLIQFSTSERDYMVDPLALADLSALEPIFANPAIEKVFHAAEYDLLCLKRDFDYQFNNLFDTMLAARILGREAFGLGALLESTFDVHLDKRFQRANWGQRPLPADLLEYASHDTHYLIALRDALKAELMARDLWELAQEDFRRATHVVGKSSSDERGLDCWRVSGSYDLPPQAAAVLQELCLYRDKVAYQVNRPLFKVLSDSTLLAIAQAQPDTRRALEELPGMTHSQVQRHATGLLEAVQRGQIAQPLHAPRTPRPDERYLERLDRLRRWRKLTGEAMGVMSDVILPRDLLVALAENAPRTPEELHPLLETVPWREAHFGAELLAVLNPPAKGRKNGNEPGGK